MKEIIGKYWTANGKIRLQLSFESSLKGDIIALLKDWRRVGTGIDPERNEKIFIFENNLNEVLQLVERKIIQNQKITIKLEEAK